MDDSSTVQAQLQAEWSELAGWRDGDDGERESLWFFPVLLLYVGFFFGPFVTALAAVFTMRGRIEPRHAAIVVGTCGTAWCLLQGLSVYNGAWWSELALQGTRSAINFAAGIITYIVIRPVAVRRFRQSSRTLAISVAVVALSLVAFLLLPASALIALGR